MKTLRVRTLVIEVILVFYAAGYISARHNCTIIHRISYVGNCYTMHDVVGGKARLFGSALNGGVALFYTPLRYAEIAWWHAAHTIGSALTAAHRKRAGI